MLPSGDRDLGYYMALAQVGIEMIAPAGIGLALDIWLDWSPWGLITGTILGFTGGLFHLVQMVNRHDAQEEQKKKRGGERGA